MTTEETLRGDLAQRTLPNLDCTSASAFARDLRTGEVLVAYESDVPKLPASNAKLVTAARSFAELGPEYRFETDLYVDGSVEENHLHGDLVLIGSGAPDFSRADLIALAEEVAAAGIETVVGSIVIDASAFDEQSLGPGWTWDDGQFDYGAKSTPLSLNRNTVDVTIAHRNGSVQVNASPTSSIVRLDVSVDVDPESEASLSVYKRRASEVIRVEGQVPPDESVEMSSPVDDPMLHAGRVFAKTLEAHGVSIDGWTQVEDDPVPVDGVPAATVESAPVADLVEEMLCRSDNFVAEQLARTVALEREGEGTWDEWEAHATTFLEARGAEAVRFRDGSGLSRYNQLSASSGRSSSPGVTGSTRRFPSRESKELSRPVSMTFPPPFGRRRGR